MNCSTYDTFMPYADCKLISLYVPEACFVIVLISAVIAFRRCEVANGKAIIRTQKPSMWKLGAWLILIPGVYSITTMLRYVLYWVSDEFSERHPVRPEDDWIARSYKGVYGFALYILMAMGSITLSFGLFIFWIAILEAIRNTPRPKPKDVETGIQMPQTSRIPNAGNSAAQQTEPSANEAEPSATLLAHAVEYDIPPTDWGSEEEEEVENTSEATPSESISEDNRPVDTPGTISANAANLSTQTVQTEKSADSVPAPDPTTATPPEASSDTSETSNPSTDRTWSFLRSGGTEVVFDSQLANTPPLSYASTVSGSSSSAASAVDEEDYLEA